MRMLHIREKYGYTQEITKASGVVKSLIFLLIKTFLRKTPKEITPV